MLMAAAVLLYDSIYTLGTTYLVLVGKHTFVAGAANDQIEYVRLCTVIPSLEPSTNNYRAVPFQLQLDVPDIGRFALRQTLLQYPRML